MNKGIIAAIIAGGVLLTVGGIVLAVALANNAFTKNGKLITNEYAIEETFTNVNIENEVADIKFEKSEDGKVKVVCIDKEKLYHEASVVEGTLKVTQIDNLKGMEKWFGYNGNLKVTVYLPEATYGDLVIKSTTGDLLVNNNYTFKSVAVESSTGKLNLENMIVNEDMNVKSSTGNLIFKNINCQNMIINSSTGDQSYKDISCNDMTIKSSTGDQSYENVNCENITAESSTGKKSFVEFIANKHFSCSGDTGNVSLKNSDADTMKITTSTGNVKGNLLTNKTFKVKTSTGKVNLPDERTGPVCEIETSTGDINISVGRID